MIIHKPIITSDGYDRSKISFIYSIGNVHEEFFYTIPVAKKHISDQVAQDASLVLGLLIGMSVGEDIKVDGVVSKQLLKGCGTIQDIWLNWLPGKFKSVSVSAEAADAYMVSKASGTGSTFTGGVDSFHTYYKHKNEISDVFYVFGYDIFLEQKKFSSKVKNAIDAIFEDLPQSVNYIDTNLRAFSDRYVSWRYFHGAALGALGILVSPKIGKLYIPSTRSYSELIPLGSHPLLDSHWSTEYIDIEHDGAGSGRTEKIAEIIDYPASLKSLRVCWKSTDAINCGVCEKCLRTMTVIDILGRLGEVKTFPDEVSAYSSSVSTADAYLASFMSDTIDWFETHPDRIVNHNSLQALKARKADVDRVIFLDKISSLDEGLARAALERLSRERTKLAFKASMRSTVYKITKKIS